MDPFIANEKKISKRVIMVRRLLSCSIVNMLTMLYIRLVEKKTR